VRVCHAQGIGQRVARVRQRARYLRLLGVRRLLRTCGKFFRTGLFCDNPSPIIGGPFHRNKILFPSPEQNSEFFQGQGRSRDRRTVRGGLSLSGKLGQSRGLLWARTEPGQAWADDQDNTRQGSQAYCIPGRSPRQTT